MIRKKLKLFLLVIALPAVLLSLAGQIGRPNANRHSDCDSVCSLKEKCKAGHTCNDCKECGHSHKNPQ